MSSKCRDILNQINWSEIKKMPNSYSNWDAKWLIWKPKRKGKYENLECRACKIENESQQHVFECNEIDVKFHVKETYEDLIEGSLRQKIEISEVMKK